MSMIGNQDFIDGVTSRCQIIVGALILGVVVMLGIATVVAPQVQGGARPGAGAKPADARDKPVDANLNHRPLAEPDMATILTWVAVAFAAVTLPLSFVLPGLIAQQNRRAIAAGTWTLIKGGSPPMPAAHEAFQTDVGPLAMVYQTQLIIGAAMNEGVAFFAAIAYMIGRNPIALGLGILLVGGLVARFPTKDRVALWMDRQQELLILDKQAAT
jgi:hypothetical protein